MAKHLITETIHHGNYRRVREFAVEEITPETIAANLDENGYLPSEHNRPSALAEIVRGLTSEDHAGEWGWVTWEQSRYDVLDNNDDVLGGSSLWWVAARSAHDNGFRVRDNETNTIQLDCRPKEDSDV